jgi:hypothetical protein
MTSTPMTCTQCGGAVRIEDRTFGRVLHCTTCGTVRKLGEIEDGINRSLTSSKQGHGSDRIRSLLFADGAFVFTFVALVLAPVLAALDLVHSYTPYLLLRLWMIGFSVYAFVLSRRAGGLRRAWQLVYVLIALVFAFVRGIEIEDWAVIDLVCATLVGLSTPFLRTEPAAPTPAA